MMETKLFDKAKEDFNQGKFEDTLLTLNDLLNRDEFHLEAVLMRGVVLRKLSNYNEALKDFDKLINLVPNDANVFSERGVTYLHMKYMDASLEDMNTAVSLEPNNPYRYSCRAYVKDKMQDDEGARSDYEKAIELDPSDEIAYNNLGLLLEKAGKKKAALKNFEQSNEQLEKKYGIKVGNGEVRPYTFKENSNKPSLANESEPIITEYQAEKLTLKRYFKIIKSLINHKSERKAFINFIKGNELKE